MSSKFRKVDGIEYRQYYETFELKCPSCNRWRSFHTVVSDDIEDCPCGAEFDISIEVIPHREK